ncbi:MAG: META domain-containing protein [Alistipes sp.]|nr:META domain-containing protein [Candidatus Alistipes equi]
MKRNLVCLALLFFVSLLLSGCCSSCRYRRNHSFPLESIEWHLCRIAGENIEPSSDKFVIVLQDGTIHGKAFCNRIMGRYKLNGSELSFLDIASTRMLCLEDNGQEARFLEKLSQVTHFDIDYKNLMLLSSGAITMVFEGVQK